MTLTDIAPPLTRHLGGGGKASQQRETPKLPDIHIDDGGQRQMRTRTAEKGLDGGERSNKILTNQAGKPKNRVITGVFGKNWLF